MSAAWHASRRSLLAVWMLGAALGAAQASAQIPARGERVRLVFTTGIGPMVGRVEGLRNDTLWIGIGRPPEEGRVLGRWSEIPVPLDEVSSMEVSLGRPSHARRHAVIAGLLGAAFGATMGLASGNDPAGTVGRIHGLFHTTAAAKAAYGAVAFGALGAGVGALLGSRTAGPEQWAPVSFTRVRVTALTYRGIGITIPLGR